MASSNSSTLDIPLTRIKLLPSFRKIIIDLINRQLRQKIIRRDYCLMKSCNIRFTGRYLHVPSAGHVLGRHLPALLSALRSSSGIMVLR